MQNSDYLPIHLFVDNRVALDLAQNPVHHQRSKHIDIRFHFIRSEVLNKTVILLLIPSNENITDLFTKQPISLTLRNLLFALKWPTI